MFEINESINENEDFNKEISLMIVKPFVRQVLTKLYTLIFFTTTFIVCLRKSNLVSRNL